MRELPDSADVEWYNPHIVPGRRLAILLPLLTLVVAALSVATPAQGQTAQPSHQVLEFGQVVLEMPDGSRLFASAGPNAKMVDLLVPNYVDGSIISLSDVRYRTTSDVEFSVEQSLTSAHLSGTFLAEENGSWPPVITLDVRWEGVGPHDVHEEMSEYRTTLSCGVRVVHAQQRFGPVSGTVNGVEVQGRGNFGNYFYQSTNDDC